MIFDENVVPSEHIIMICSETCKPKKLATITGFAGSVLFCGFAIALYLIMMYEASIKEWTQLLGTIEYEAQDEILVVRNQLQHVPIIVSGNHENGFNWKGIRASGQASMKSVRRERLDLE